MRYIISLLFFMFLAIGTQAETFKFKFEKQIKIGQHPKLMLKNKIGAISVESAPIDFIEVNAFKNIKAANQAEAERMAEFIDINVVKSGDHLNIETVFLESMEKNQSFWDRLLGRAKDVFGSVEYTIKVPINCEVNIDNPRGNIHVKGVENEVYAINSEGQITIELITGPVFVETMSGKLNIIEVIGDVNLISSGSDIKLEFITGRIDIKATSGKTVARHIDGPINITHTSGAIEVADLLGDLRITATSGSINVIQETGGIDISTNGGNVEIATSLESDRGFSVTTKKGSIKFNVPETSSGTVNLKTESGGINTELPLVIRSFTKNKLIGDFGKSGPKITLATTTGDITLGLY